MIEFSTFTWIAIFSVSAAVVNAIGIFAIYCFYENEPGITLE